MVVVVVVVDPVSLLLLQADVWDWVDVVVHWALLPLPLPEPPAAVPVVVELQVFTLSATADPDGTTSASATSAPMNAALRPFFAMFTSV